MKKSMLFILSLAILAMLGITGCGRPFMNIFGIAEVSVSGENCFVNNVGRVLFLNQSDHYGRYAGLAVFVFSEMGDSTRVIMPGGDWAVLPRWGHYQQGRYKFYICDASTGEIIKIVELEIGARDYDAWTYRICGGRTNWAAIVKIGPGKHVVKKNWGKL